jgi:UDP-N-acetylglucosamine--N-acetylmuramyl-(pentapeptide) pyrophosphoryl-undecaprenol N-acetylglucosamine transferase
VTSIVLAGGGTAGHVLPALATAEALIRHQPQVRLTFLGTERGLESRLVTGAGHELVTIPAIPMPRRPGGDLLAMPGRWRAAVGATREVLASVQAQAVVGFGGYVSAPAYAAGRAEAVAVVVHESNARPGWANRLGARFADAVATAAPGIKLRGAQPIGIPLRRSITTLDRGAMRAEARRYFGLDPDRPTLLAFGGSQGSKRINAAVSVAAADLVAAGAQVLHAVGASGAGMPEVAPDIPGYAVRSYLDRMDLAYAAADLALCRAGALTVAELTALGLPAAYVPLPIGNGEQRLNAEPVVAAGGGVLVADEDCSPAWVRSQLAPLLRDEAALAKMAAAARRSGHADADDKLAGIVMATIEKPK